MNVERAVLGSIILSKSNYLALLDLGLQADMFLAVENRDVFCALVDYYTSHPDAHQIAIPNLSVPGWTTMQLGELIDFTETEGSYLYLQYFEALRKTYLKEMSEQAFQLSDRSNPDALIELSQRLTALALGHTRESYTMEDIMKQSQALIEERNKEGYENVYRTSLYHYDQLGHFERGSLLVLGGESGHGKSTFALNLTYRWLQKGLRVVYFSFEMPHVICLSKLNCIHTKLPWDRAFVTKDMKLNGDDYLRFYTGYAHFLDKPLLLNVSSRKLSEMEMIVQNFNANIFILDTVNELIPADGNRTDIQLGHVARQFKRMAVRQNNLAVIIAQLKDIPGRPTDKNLIKESRQIRDAADYMDFIYREEEKNIELCPPELERIMEIWRVKGRLTGVGKAYIYFNKHTGHVDTLTEPRIKQIRDFLKGVSG